MEPLHTGWTGIRRDTAGGVLGNRIGSPDAVTTIRLDLATSGVTSESCDSCAKCQPVSSNDNTLNRRFISEYNGRYLSSSQCL